MTTFEAGGGSVLQIVRYGREEMDKHEHQMASGASDIEPGMVLERTDNSGEIRVQAVSTTVDTAASRYVAIEADERGMQADLEGGDQDPYIEGENDLVHYVRMSGGGAHVLLASGTDLGDDTEANISAGEKLVTAGGANLGAVKKYDSANDDGDAVLFEAEEGVDNSGAAAGETTFIEVTAA